MNWFSGNIAEAVGLSKTRNAIFVVFCEGTDVLSKTLKSVIDDEKIRNHLESSHFVAIKIQSDSEAYVQFSQIYKLVPLPSIFFIGKNGAPLEVVTGVTQTVDELLAKIEIVLQRANLKNDTIGSVSSTASQNLIESEKSAEDDEFEVVCKDGVCYKQPKQEKGETGEASSSTATSTDLASEEKLKRAREVIEKKRKDKEEEDARLARERELQRRRVGQDLINFKQRQEETEMKKLQEERKRDKIEEQAIRKRILEQIAQDKAERAQRFNTNVNSSESSSNEASNNETAPPPAPIVFDSAIARIQFKKPDGKVEVQLFPSTEAFSVIRSHVEQNIIASSGIREFALATTFPRKEFKVEDNPKTLLELGLVPSCVILILPLDKAPASNLPLRTSYGIISLLSTVIWGVVNPVLAAFSYLRGWIFSENRSTGATKRASEEELSPNDVAKRRLLKINNQETVNKPETSGAYRRVGSSNIHRLHENNDSDDENNTWNGNSTQQQ